MWTETVVDVTKLLTPGVHAPLFAETDPLRLTEEGYFWHGNNTSPLRKLKNL
ncbi:MAG: hypothetical protein DDT37_00887 [Firmicutes bacterium]|nr:hypothetical protein [candidate division NPL-UPA2 bacterium]